MAVTIRKMTDDEFEKFYGWSIQNHAKELTEELQISYDAARAQAQQEVAGMLPDGLETADNHLMTIAADGETVGFIWTLHEEFQGKKQSFLCDFAIWEDKRRKGYGQAALLLAEQREKADGCVESVLFVADDNAAAIALYGKNGYQAIRQKDHGKFMRKPLV